MKKKYLFYILIFSAFILSNMSCSDNMNVDLLPYKTETKLDFEVDSKDFNNVNDHLSFDAAANSVNVNVDSNTRWGIDVTDDGGWCSVDTYNGSGIGSFMISVKENLRNAVRDATVTIFKTDLEGNKSGEKHIYVSQAASSINISPMSVQTFPAEATETHPNMAEFTIESNVPWTLSVSFPETSPFLTISKLEGNMELSGNGENQYSGRGTARFEIRLQNNRSSTDRRAILTLHGEGTLEDKTVEITQLKTTNVFDVSPMESQLIDMQGGTIDFGLVSIFNWSVSSAAEWITFSQTSGESCPERVSITVTVAPNITGYERHTQIWFTPDIDSGVERTSVSISQTGSREPAISMPWLADGFGQTYATVLFNYFSPFEKIVHVGLQWRINEEEGWQSRSVSVSSDDTTNEGDGIKVSGNDISGTVVVDLQDLEAATDYVARGYVIDEKGNVKYGTTSHLFRTAGQYPDKGDANTPTY